MQGRHGPPGIEQPVSPHFHPRLTLRSSQVPSRSAHRWPEGCSAAPRPRSRFGGPAKTAAECFIGHLAPCSQHLSVKAIANNAAGSTGLVLATATVEPAGEAGLLTQLTTNGTSHSGLAFAAAGGEHAERATQSGPGPANRRVC